MAGNPHTPDAGAPAGRKRSPSDYSRDSYVHRVGGEDPVEQTRAFTYEDYVRNRQRGQEPDPPAHLYSRERYTGAARRGSESDRHISDLRSDRSGRARSHEDSRSADVSRFRDRGVRTDGRGGIPLKPIAIAVAVVVVLALLVAKPFGSGGSSGDGGIIQISTGAADGSDEVAADDALPTPIIAESAGIQVHSAVAAGSLTEILIHNASYAYAQEISTQLTEATNSEVMENHGTGRDASEQPTGDAWMTGEFIRCFRASNAGPKMSAIDCGGPVGTTVYAPVSGKVVLVKEYQLYDKYPDIQVHIQPDGRDDIDVVLIHLTDAAVQAGDTVVAGKTPLARIRDVYAYIGQEMQLKEYTAVDDNGNHTHIQVNDATDKDYHGLDDLKKPEAETGAEAVAEQGAGVEAAAEAEAGVTSQ